MKNNFTTIKSQTGIILLQVGRPDEKNRVNVFTTFDPRDKHAFIEALKRLGYATLNIVAYDDKLLQGGFSITLTEENSLSRLIEDLPELVYEHIEIHEFRLNTLADGSGG